MHDKNSAGQRLRARLTHLAAKSGPIADDSKFRAMSESVRRTFPEMTIKQHRYACNKLGNLIRNYPNDVYYVGISREFEQGRRGGYHNYHTIEVGPYTVHILVTVD